MSVLHEVIDSLCGIEVKGESNLYLLLGSIQTLKKLEAAQLAEAKRKAAEAQKEPEEVTSDG